MSVKNVLAVALGILAGALRTVRFTPLRWAATAYVEFFRNIPLLVQMFLWYFVLPELLPKSMGDAFKQMNPLAQQYIAALICLGLFTAARVAEQVRAGIGSLARGQRRVMSAIELCRTAAPDLVNAVTAAAERAARAAA